MFCPSCGIEDPNHNQFCRSCGTSLHAVRNLIEHPDAITISAVTAREEIGRAIASKIAQFEDSGELRQAVHEILPAIERFLESPEEKRSHQREQRLNQMREGVLTSIVGLGVILSFLLISWITNQEKILIVSALGLLVLMIGLGITVTALWFSMPKDFPISSQRVTPRIDADEEPKSLPDQEAKARQTIFHSVTEGTTREL